jgi:septal ring factor EnvC (AmiA/AmiB activator)
LQSRAEQLDIDLRPENLDRSLATYGTTRPEEVREQRRRYLESERARVRAQLETLATSRVRLESAIANADAEVDRLRSTLDAPPATTEQRIETDETNTEGATTTTQTPTTSTPPPM